MRLSGLQKYILTKCYYDRNSIAGKHEFYSFYSKNELEKHKKSVQDTVHKSIDSLVEKDLLVAYGHRTAHKWFIHKVRITSRGKKLIRELIKGRQRKLPIK
jgi:DNA-binding MarR family transcriptional regulator